MSHLSKEQVIAYLEQSIDNREEMENHLLTCDNCMELYLNVIDNQTYEAAPSSDFTNTFMQQMNKTIVTPSKGRTNRALIHYAIAAGFTVLLTVSGVFQGVMQATNDQQMEQKPSISEHLMLKTDQWIEKLKGEGK
ncbi:hypothetical protein [Gracilibacillus salinarum]|uniref:Zinc-finger domain-containing protein n=1 Tax=Gracilibacillus salinarum TaxID=2932255 RepID=A0ABY4GNN5_9BACI|nr:hypothetical protein [Gracilibacillus salinarum]UOQ85801.1 hypothetical protein MUN87_02530 [Gracilibacillus salinarum]